MSRGTRVGYVCRSVVRACVKVLIEPGALHLDVLYLDHRCTHKSPCLQRDLEYQLTGFHDNWCHAPAPMSRLVGQRHASVFA